MLPVLVIWLPLPRAWTGLLTEPGAWTCGLEMDSTGISLETSLDWTSLEGIDGASLELATRAGALLEQAPGEGHICCK